METSHPTVDRIINCCTKLINGDRSFEQDAFQRHSFFSFFLFALRRTDVFVTARSVIRQARNENVN